MDAAVPAANNTNTIAQPINIGFPAPELFCAAEGAGTTGGGGIGAGGCGTFGVDADGVWARRPQLPQNGPAMGEPQLVQKLGMGRFYRSEPRVTTEMFHRKIALRSGIEIAVQTREGGQI